MNPNPGGEIDLESWPRYRWWMLVPAVLVFQLLMIFWLGYHGPGPMLPKKAGLNLSLARNLNGDSLALGDPTLFALPHPQGFAGRAWLAVPDRGAQPYAWSEPPQWLTLPLQELGNVFHTFLATNQSTHLPSLDQTEPTFVLPEAGGLLVGEGQSRFRVLGDLAGRPMLTPFSLSSWTNAEALTNSVVQLLVGAAGRPVSITLLSSSSSSTADQFALKLAEGARFQPVGNASSKPPDPLTGLSWGQIVFEWNTIPPPPTNH
jgi:hypothetical protein